MAENIANANTPGYLARDVSPFQSHLDALSSPTNSHSTAGVYGAPPQVQVVDAHSETDGGVDLEHELLNAGEVGRQQSVNNAIVRAFQRMYLASTKG